MKTKVLAITLIVALVSAAIYQLGLLERPPFEYHDSLLRASREFLVVVATSSEKNIGAAVDPLLKGSKQAILSLENGKAMLEAAAKMYGAPVGAESLALGLYLDNPKTADHPRWAIGWAVEGVSKKELDDLVEAMQKASGLPKENKIRVVRIGEDPVLKAKIPWRNMLTPMIAPMLHWGRGIEAYEKGGYKTTDTNKEGLVLCLEAYVLGPRDSFEYIEYVLMWGKGSETTMNDVFPTEKQAEGQETSTE